MTDLHAALKLLAAGWPQEMSREQVAAYAEGLGDVPGPDLLAVVTSAIRTDRWRPAVADLRLRVLEACGDLGPPASEATAQAQALDWWYRRSRIAPGAGPVAERPDVHPLVERAWIAAGPDAPPGVFSARYRDERERAGRAAAARRLDAAPALDAPAQRSIGA